MSYNLDLFRVPSGLAPEDAWHKHITRHEAQVIEPRDEPVDPAKEQMKHRIAATLVARYSTLELFTPNYSKIAKAQSIDETEARRRFRSVELTDEKLNVQITLFDDSAGISLSHVGSKSDSRNAVRMVWHCLEILESEGGFSTYDQQLGKVLDLYVDFDTVLKCYAGF